mgnify:CR=1 FL=1
MIINFLYSIVILPIEQVVEYIFTFIVTKFPSVGVIGAILSVSIAINLLALPLYNAADALQEKEREEQKRMTPMLRHIKKAFTGDERFMMTQAYFRECGYHPLYAFRSSLSVLLEIPFFIAAYHFLSHCTAISEMRFWIFSDLGKPDALLKIGGISVNVLPFIMTAINLISASVYARALSRRDKIQLFAVAAVFFALLYNSPAALELYWICNNLFSLVKNIVSKTGFSQKIVYGALIVFAILFASYFLSESQDSRIGIKMLVVAFELFAVFLNPIVRGAKKAFKMLFSKDAGQNARAYRLLWISCGCALALFLGFLLPSGTLASSPAEFSFVGETDSPISYLWTSFAFFAGVFIFWPLVFAKIHGGGYNFFF